MSTDEPPAGLQVEQATGDVLGGDVEVELALPGATARGYRSLVSTSMMYACSSPASRRNSVFDNEQSPQKNPARWSRTSSPTSASSRRSPRYGIVMPRPDSSVRYGSE